MTTALATLERNQIEPASANQVLAQVRLIQEVMQTVMKPGTHYGTIPGTKKPSLFKPGSETILSTFRIAVKPEVEDLSDDDCVKYRVRAVGELPNGQVVGIGIGEASSNEEKYKWRRAVCDEEYNETPEDRRRLKWSKWKEKVQSTKQVRVNPADVANTILKMAKKRAQIDLCLTATAASDCFTQDLEDLPKEVAEAVAGNDQPTVQQPRKKSQPQEPAPDEDLSPPKPSDADRPDPEDLDKCQTVTGVVEGVTQKKGKTNDIAWVRFSLHLVEHNTTYNTFNLTLATYTQSLKNQGVIVYFEQDGKFTNLVWVDSNGV